MQSPRPSLASRARRAAARVIGALIVLNVALVLWIWVQGPLKLDLGKLPFGLGTPNPLTLLPALGIIWCLLEWRSWRSWFGLAPEHVFNFRGVHPLAWVVMPISAAMLGAQLQALPGHAMSTTDKVRKSARKGPAAMSINGANKHVGPLVRRLVQRQKSDPVVVWIDDLDRRGHTAAYYLYPRLMLMEPAERRFTLRQRMAGFGGTNPYFNPGPRSSMAAAQAFAKERGAEFVFVDRKGRMRPPR